MKIFTFVRIKDLNDNGSQNRRRIILLLRTPESDFHYAYALPTIPTVRSPAAYDRVTMTINILSQMAILLNARHIMYRF
jgi:hypothetical protein